MNNGEIKKENQMIPLTPVWTSILKTLSTGQFKITRTARLKHWWKNRRKIKTSTVEERLIQEDLCFSVHNDVIEIVERQEDFNGKLQEYTHLYFIKTQDWLLEICKEEHFFGNNLENLLVILKKLQELNDDQIRRIIK